MKTLITVATTLFLAVLTGLALAYAGAFNVAADQPHSAPVSRLLEIAREQGIAKSAHDVVVPDNLIDPKVIADGAGEYAEMCAECHLSPGAEETELRAGLYPKPPELARPAMPLSAAEQFWIIKHGIKMTGMPAWGLTHDDTRLWSMVAFIRKLPSLTAEQYRELSESGAGHHHHDAEEEESSDHVHADDDAPPGTALDGSAVDAAKIVDEFQHQLHQGHAETAAAMLEPDLLVFEGGESEKSRAEYSGHHLGADSKFLQNATVRRISRRGKAVGDLAWIATESEITAAGEKPVDLISTETVVLAKTPDGWRLAHIHWSSRVKK